MRPIFDPKSNCELILSSSNALVFKLCPLLFLLTAVTILVVQFSPTTNPAVLPIQFAGNATLFMQLAGFVLVYAVAFIWAAKPRTAWEWTCVLSAAAVLPASTLMLPYSLSQTVAQSPITFDLNVVPLDGALGFQPSIEMAKIFVRSPVFADICRFFYDQILVVIAIAAVGEAYYGRRLGVGAIPTFLLMSSIGFLIYFSLPVVGPAPFFGDQFPLVTGQLSATAPRNCMPSLHTAYAIMAFLSTRGANVFFQFMVGIMSALVATATLGLGEHYLIDLVLAFPLVLLFRAVSTTKIPLVSRERMLSLIMPAFLLLIWGGAVRGAWVLPPIKGFVVLAMVATVGGSLFLERRLNFIESRKGISAEQAGTSAGKSNSDNETSLGMLTQASTRGA